MADDGSVTGAAKEKFEALLKEHYVDKTGPIKPWTRDHVAKVIKCLHGANLALEIGQRRTIAENYFSRSYDVLSVDGVERVIVKKSREDGSVRIMLPREEYFDTMQMYHERMGHVGFDKLCNAVRQRFVVPIHVVSMFVKCCNICQDKVNPNARRHFSKKKKKGTGGKIGLKPTSMLTRSETSQVSLVKNSATDNNYAAEDARTSDVLDRVSNTATMPCSSAVPPAPPPATQKQPTPPQQPPPQPPKIVLPQASTPKPIAPKPIATPVSPLQPLPPPPEVCLRWNSYHSNMQATFPSLLNNEQFVDVTLACEGRSIKCHKMMLSACSAYFEELLSQNPCQHPIVLMKDLKYWEVQALVDFMYRGEVNVAQDKLPSLLAAAEALQIKGLAGPAFSSHDEENAQSAPLSSAEDYLEESIPSPTGGARRARKRRVMSSAQSPRPQTVQSPQLPVASTRNTTGKRVVKPTSATPSTSNYHAESSSPSSEPLARRPRKSDSGELEIKIEPIDIEISNDSMDQMDESFLEKTFDDAEAVDGGESSCQGDDPGGTCVSRRTSSGSKRNLRGNESEQMDYGSNEGNDQNFKYEDSASQDDVSSVPDLPGTSYQDSLSQPSGSGMNSTGRNLADKLLGHM